MPKTAVPTRPDDARYRQLVEAVTDYAIYMLDPAGTIISWNPGAERFKGYTADEILGQNFSSFYSEEDRGRGLPQRALATAAREGRFEGEGWRIRKDGTRFWANVVVDPIRDPDGGLIGFAKITRDLTAKREAAETLRQSEERYRLLVEAVTDYAIYMIDPAGIVTNWNPGAQRIKGYLPEEIVGQHFSRFYTEEDRANGEPARALATAAQAGRYEKEAWRVRKDGTRFWASVVLDPIRDDLGRLIGYAKVTRDMTERRNAQQALETAREQLFQSQKMEAIGQLTGGVAHDFNNLLMVILGSLEMLRKRLPADERLLRLLDNAVQGAQRGAALTQRMLAFARRQELRPAAVDLTSLVHGMSDLLRRSLGTAIEIDTRFPLGLAKAFADSNQLELALLNLVVNARDAMPDGGKVRIDGREEDVREGGALAAGRYVVLSVADTGTGMDEATIARAVEPFFTTKGPGKGTGLGLSMVHGVLEQLGGRLRLESRAGEGTIAELWLPAAAAVPETAARAEPAAIPSVRPLTVLAVDDDGLVLMNTIEMLTDLGHAAIAASSASGALEILARQPVDLLVTDQVMPRISGVELAEMVHQSHPGIPVILATGYAELPAGLPADIVRLAKPFRQDDLRRAIAETSAARPGEERRAAS